MQWIRWNGHFYRCGERMGHNLHIRRFLWSLSKWLNYQIHRYVRAMDNRFLEEGLQIEKLAKIKQLLELSSFLGLIQLGS